MWVNSFSLQWARKDVIRSYSFEEGRGGGGGGGGGKGAKSSTELSTMQTVGLITFTSNPAKCIMFYFF